MEVVIDIPDAHLGFDGKSFMRRAHALDTYQRLGLERFAEFMEMVYEFTDDEPGRVDC